MNLREILDKATVQIPVSKVADIRSLLMWMKEDTAHMDSKSYNTYEDIINYCNTVLLPYEEPLKQILEEPHTDYNQVWSKSDGCDMQPEDTPAVP